MRTGSGSSETWLDYIDITRDMGEKGGAQAINPEGKGVYVCAAARNFVAGVLLNSAEELPVGTCLLVQLQHNAKSEFTDQPYFCGKVHRLASRTEFDDNVETSKPDELDVVIEALVVVVKSMISSLTDDEILAAVRKQDSSVKLSDPKFQSLAKAIEAKAAEENEQKARDALAQIMDKGAIPGLICQQSGRLIELGSEVYWQNGNHPKTIVTDLDGCEPVSEPEPEPVAA